MGRPRKIRLEPYESEFPKVHMICSKSTSCYRPWSCRHRDEHLYGVGCAHTICDRLSICYGSRCKEVL